MGELAEFITARLDEAEAKARSCAGPHWCGCGHVTFVMTAGACDCGYPARVLADVEAKRQIIAEHQPEDGFCRTCTTEDREVLWDGETETVEWVRRPVPAPCPTLRALALPYTKHSDSQPEPRP